MKLPEISIRKEFTTDSFVIKATFTPEWLADATIENKLYAVLQFADVFAKAMGLHV